MDTLVNQLTLNFIMYQLHHVPFYASVYMFGKKSVKYNKNDGIISGEDNNAVFELFCGTADVSERFTNDRIIDNGLVQLFKSQEIEMDNNTYQLFEFKGENFEIIDPIPVNVLFQAFKTNSLFINSKLFGKEIASNDAKYLKGLLIGNVGISKRVVGVTGEMHKQPICKIIFGGTRPVIKEYPTQPEQTRSRTMSLSSSTATIVFKEQMPPFMKTFKEQKLQPVEINLNEYDNSMKMKDENKLQMQQISVEQPKQPQLTTSYIEGDIQVISSSTEDFKLHEDNSFCKNKSIKTIYMKSMEENTFENGVLKNARKFDKSVRNENEAYSIKIPNGFILCKIGANPINLTFKKQIAITDDEIENIDSNLNVTVTNDSNPCLIKFDELKEVYSKMYKTIKIIEGPSECSTEKSFKSKRLLSGATFMSERITISHNLPVYEVLSAPSGVEKKRLLKTNTYDVQIIENNVEFPKNYHEYQLEDMLFTSNITYDEETLDCGIKANKKTIYTFVSISNNKTENKDDDYFKQTFECPIEKNTKLMAIENLQSDDIIEHQKTLITQWIKPIIELKFKKEGVPELKLRYVKECTDIRDVLVNLYSGKIEPHAKNCEVSIIVIPEALPKSTNAKQIVPSLINSVKRIVYDVKIIGPRIIQKIIEGDIIVKNHVEEFNKVANDGQTNQHYKVYTSKHYRPTTIITECNKKPINSEKNDKLIKTVIKESIFEIPKSNLLAKDCDINIDVVFDEIKLADNSLLSKTIIIMSLLPCRAPSAKKQNTGLTLDEYDVEEETQTDNSSYSTMSIDGCRCQHEVKTQNHVKKYFKKFDIELKMKSHIPHEEELVEQIITEKILEIPENITDLNNSNVCTKTTERWFNGKTACGASKFHHIITTKAFLKNDNVEYDYKQIELGHIEEIEGDVMTLSEMSEEEKTLNDTRVKKKIITNKYIRPITTLKYINNNKVPEINIKEDLLKIEINEYEMELDCELCDPSNCVSIVDSYNYIKYLPNGVPVNTEVTKITAKLKRDKKEMIVVPATIYETVNIETGNILDSDIETINDTRLVPTVVDFPINLSLESGSKMDIEEQRVTRNVPKSKVEIEMKQKVSTSENQQQLPNGYLKKIKTVNVNHFRIERTTNPLGEIDVKEYLFKIDVQEIITVLANIKVKTFAYNCKTAAVTKYEKSLIDNNVEVNKSIVTFVVMSKDQNSMDTNLSDVFKKNQLTNINYGLITGELETREVTQLDELVLNDSTMQKKRTIIRTKFRPLYILKTSKNEKEKLKVLLDECIEEVYTFENIIDVPKRMLNKYSSYDFDLKHFHHEYNEYFQQGVLHKKRTVKAKLLDSKTNDNPSIEVEDNIEMQTEVLCRKDDMHSNGSLYRELVIRHKQVRPIIKLELSSDSYLESVLMDSILDCKTFNLAFYIPACDMLNENSCKVEINSHINQKIENPTQNFQIHIQPNLPIENKIYEWGNVNEKLTEDEKETYLNDGTLVKWKTTTIQSFCPIFEMLDHVEAKNKVNDFLIRTEIYVVIVELGPELVVDDLKQKFSVKITKDTSDVFSPDERRAYKTVIKFILSPTINKKLTVPTLTDSNTPTHKELKLEKDSKILSDGTKIFQNVAITSKLKPYYEIAETREPMLKDDLISQEVDDIEIHLKPDYKLIFDNDKSQKRKLMFKSSKILCANDIDREKIIFTIKCSEDTDDCDIGNEFFKNVNDAKTLVGILDVKEEFDGSSSFANNIITQSKLWSSIYYTPLVELICGNNDITECSVNKIIVFKKLLNAEISLPVNTLKSNMCNVAIGSIRSIYNCEDTLNYNKTTYATVEFKTAVKITLKVKPVIAKKPILKSVEFKNEPIFANEPKVTTKVEEGDVMTRKTEQTVDEKLQDGSIIRKSITTTNYYRPHIEKVYIDEIETACNITETPLNSYIEESMLHLPLGIDNYDADLWKTDVISVIESEYKQPDGSNVEKKTMHLVLAPKEKLPVVSLATPVLKDDVIETRRLEGDIQTNVKVTEEEESVIDGSILKKKIIITKFIKPITERTYKNGILINEVNSVENIGSEVEEIYLNLPTGVIEPFGSNLDTETSINHYDDVSSDQLPIKRKVIKMKVRLKPSSTKPLETSIMKIDNETTGSTIQSSSKKIEGDLVSSTSYSERSSIGDDGTKFVCKRTTTRFFRPIAEITITNGCITNAEINEQTSHFDIFESITELAPDVSNVNEPNIVAMSSEEIFNDKTPDGVPVLRNVKTTKLVKTLGTVQQDKLKSQATEEIEYEVCEDEVDSSLWYTSEYVIDGQIYKKLLINEGDLIDDKNTAVMNSIYPSLFLKKYEIIPSIKVYSHTIENQPVINSKVQEFVDILPDGTKVKRRVTETVEKRTVIKRLAVENEEIKNMKLKEVFDVFDLTNPGQLLNKTNAREEICDIIMTDGGILRKMTKMSNGSKFSSETEFMVTTVHANNVDDFYDSNLF